MNLLSNIKNTNDFHIKQLFLYANQQFKSEQLQHFFNYLTVFLKTIKININLIYWLDVLPGSSFFFH